MVETATPIEYNTFKSTLYVSTYAENPRPLKPIDPIDHNCLWTIRISNLDI